MENLDEKNIWHDCLESIKVSVSSANFSTWFFPTHLVSLIKKGSRFQAEVGCPSAFVKATLENRYYGLIQDVLGKLLETRCDLTFSIKDLPKQTNDKLKPHPLFDENKNSEDMYRTQISNARLRTNYTFENFAVSSSNQLAWAAAEAVSKEPGSAYNPLFIWGGVGVGKTHLMSAVGHEILKKDPDKNVYFCTGEEFTNDIVEGIRQKATQSFRNKYRRLYALFIDDIQFIAGKDTVQEEFFHTFNAIVSAGGQIILTSDKPPSDISRLEERLRSRFEAGLIVDISPPDFELRCAILQIKAKEKNLSLATDIVQLIAGNVDSARKMEGFLVKLSSTVSLNKNPMISPELVKQVLGKGVEETNGTKKASFDEVIEAICKYFSIGKRVLLSESRMQKFALPRQILMYILRTDLGLQLTEVGRLVGGRDHTTVMHAVDKVTRLASEDMQIREDIQGIKKLL